MKFSFQNTRQKLKHHRISSKFIYFRKFQRQIKTYTINLIDCDFYLVIKLRCQSSIFCRVTLSSKFWSSTSFALIIRNYSRSSNFKSSNSSKHFYIYLFILRLFQNFVIITLQFQYNHNWIIQLQHNHLYLFIYLLIYLFHELRYNYVTTKLQLQHNSLYLSLNYRSLISSINCIRNDP